MFGSGTCPGYRNLELNDRNLWHSILDFSTYEAPVRLHPITDKGTATDVLDTRDHTNSIKLYFNALSTLWLAIHAINDGLSTEKVWHFLGYLHMLWLTVWPKFKYGSRNVILNLLR